MKWFSQPGSIWDMGPRFPVLDRQRQSSIPGLYMAGDVTGTPDIKAAINAGAEVARHILLHDNPCKPSLDFARDKPCDAHVLIIGGGPAGVAAALEFEKNENRNSKIENRSSAQRPLPLGAHKPPLYLLLEKKQLFTTLRNFAKCKPLFYASTGDAEVKSELWWGEPAPGGAVCSGDLVAEWERQLTSARLNARLGETVTDIQKTDKFRVVTDRGSYVCDRVILSIGKLIYLTRLGVGAEADPKVFYEPPEPGRFRDRDVLVVGATNEALETALALAASNRVTLAHANSGFPDADAELVKAVEAQIHAGKLNRLASAKVKEVREDEVVLELHARVTGEEMQTPRSARGDKGVESRGAEEVRLKNDLVFPFLGVDKTELPLAFFRQIHVEYERDWHLQRYLLFLFTILAVGAFYLLKKFMPGVVMIPAPGWLGLPGNEWDLGSLYPLLYTLVVAVFGVKAIWRWKKLRWRVKKEFGGQQTLRLASLIFFQTFFFFLVPLFILKDWRAWGLLYPWPLVFHPGTVEHFQASAFWWWWSLGLVLLAVPVFTYFHGKKFCTWVCGCGGLAETLGDTWRHYSPKGVGNTKKERQLYIVTGFAAVATVLVAAGYDFGVAGLRLSALYSYTVDLFLIAIIPVALYAFLGGKIWCRYWCPVVGWMNLVGAKTSRFRISADKHRCIACNLCSRYCEVGVDVMKFAVKGEAFGMWNSSCIGCGVCIHVCPTDVLTFGHHQLVTLPTAPPLRQP